MSTITIQHLNDHHNCETCGYHSAEGFEVKIDGEVFGDYEPVSYCWDAKEHYLDMVMADILRHLGHTVEFKD